MASETSPCQLQPVKAAGKECFWARESKRRFREACIQGKMHQKPHKPLNQRRNCSWCIRMFVVQCKPSHLEEVATSSHLQTTIQVYFLKEKSEALEKFKEFKASVETESGQSIKALRADRGGEYLLEEFSCYL